MQQLSLMFEPGLAASARSLREHLARCVYQRGLSAVAGKIDLSPSKLTEKLAGGDSSGKPRGLTIDELEAYIVATGDKSPIHYLADKYLRDPAVQRDEALAKLLELMGQIAPLAASAGLDIGAPAPKRGRAR